MMSIPFLRSDVKDDFVLRERPQDFPWINLAKIDRFQALSALVLEKKASNQPLLRRVPAEAS
jgi:hypothetical protein